MKAIETCGLTKYYGKNRGIEDLNLQVETGEFLGCVGPNGAGKSTTIRTLLGLISPTSGSASLLGIDISRREEILRKVGYLPSETVFYSGMKVRDVLKMSADLRGVDCSRETAQLCERLQLDAGKKVETLSFGNRKKVGVVCALQHRPELLILDEPTGGLDPLMQRELFDILQERNREGTTVFLSSHVLSEIQRYCTRAAILRAGRLIACDQVEALASTNAKRVTVHGAVDLTGLQGVRDWKSGEEGARFLYSGEMPQLLQHLAAGQVTDLSITEPDLEEVFLHYYQKGAEEV
ncbi:MAG: ABC transporter ATP-binding protein [Clostridia bacterium]|nr:ABC transporter ATP-binding protein [Clostridia bacterium]